MNALCRPECAARTISPPGRFTSLYCARSGADLGKTVQVIPHITHEIQTFIERGVQAAKALPDIAIVEIGGMVGDIESLPFLEAARQMRLRLGQRQACFVHLTLVPYLPASSELKTKPTQHSVQKLREI